MTDNSNKKKEEMICGIIMPISQHPDYPREHWKDVLDILNEAISETEFKPKLVSDDPAIGLIHQRIVQNIYNNEVIICDVSSKNPNVMFELGLRLAFDKPTIIIKDEKTGYSFDTGVVEHIEYPSSLRFSKILEFKTILTKKLQATYEKSVTDPNFSPFLKSFGQRIVPASITSTDIPESSYIINQLNLLGDELKAIRIENKLNTRNFGKDMNLDFKKVSYGTINNLIDRYHYLAKTPTKHGQLKFILKHLLEEGYQVTLTELEVFFEEQEEWKRNNNLKSGA